MIEHMWNTRSIQAKALLYTILLSAICHLVITLFSALFTGMPDKANMFVVLGVNLIWPNLGIGSLNAVLGGLAVALIWVVVFSSMQYNKRSKKTKKAKHENSV
jgi:predicted membrane protein